MFRNPVHRFVWRGLAADVACVIAFALLVGRVWHAFATRSGWHVGENSPFHSLTREKANRRRKLVLRPGYVNHPDSRTARAGGAYSRLGFLQENNVRLSVAAQDGEPLSV